MHYFAGLFDAEGYVTLGKDGRFQIGTEMANESVPSLFKEKFGGNIYSRKRKGNKKTWTWVIATNRNEAISFIDIIAPFSVLKRSQLCRLKDYLNEPRHIRAEIRYEISRQLSDLKKPLPLTKEQIRDGIPKKPDQNFWKWFAGFLDGDGNFCVYEYKGKKSILFDSWISVFNIFPEPIAVIQDRFPGCISQYKGSKFPIWKWVCSQKDSTIVCESLFPFLRIKKEQCGLVQQFLKIQNTKTRMTSYSFDQINRIREIITQIKHLNLL